MSVLTLGRDAEVWELWGHNTIVVADRAARDQPVLQLGALRFPAGELHPAICARPRCGTRWGRVRPTASWPSTPRAIGRWCCSDLALTAAQSTTLQEFLEWNDLPANRDYFYNYYLDNCSTRVRDAIDRALGGPAQAAVRQPCRRGTPGAGKRGESSGGTCRSTWWSTWRSGHPVDVEMTAWQAMFLPRRLMEYLRTARVAGASGQPTAAGEPGAGTEPEFPLRRSRCTAAHLDPAARHRPAGWGHCSRPWAARRGASRAARRWFAVLGSAWSFLAGFLGLLLLGLWFLTDHWSSRNNENVLLLTPISLALVVLIPLASGVVPVPSRDALTVASVVAGLAVLALVIKVLPWFHQHNLELIGLILPVHCRAPLGSPARHRARPSAAARPSRSPRTSTAAVLAMSLPIVSRSRSSARLKRMHDFPMSSFLPAFLNPCLEFRQQRLAAVDRHEVEARMVLLCGERGVAQRVSVVRVGIDLQRDPVHDHAPPHRFLVTLRQVLPDDPAHARQLGAPISGQAGEICGHRHGRHPFTRARASFASGKSGALCSARS